VVRLALIPAALLVAAGIAGCSLSGSSTASSGSFTGAAGDVAVTLNALSSDASSNNAADICSSVLDTAALARLAKVGDCKTIVTNQIKTINDFTLTIESIHVHGKTATASVQTVRGGTKVLGTINLTDEAAGWRVDSL
jgi:hypothetical protein